MSWRFESVPLDTRTRLTRIRRDGMIMRYREVIAAWHDEPGFAVAFSTRIANTIFDAIFWETPPITNDSIDREFECVEIDAPLLDRMSCDTTSFAEHFEAADAAVIRFPNLGGDAELVVPVPRGFDARHIAEFCRRSDEDQLIALWRSTAEAIRQHVGAEPLWVSTSGAGVAWVHIRLDHFPKYYNHLSYKTIA